MRQSRHFLGICALLAGIALTCGCTGSPPLETNATMTPTPIAESTATAAPAAERTATPVPTSTPASPGGRFSVGEIVADSTGTQLIVQKHPLSGKYCIRPAVRDAAGNWFIKPAEYKFQTEGVWCNISAFDALGYAPLSAVSCIPVRSTDGTISGFLEAATNETMRYVTDRPDLLSGKVQYVLTLEYTGDVWVNSTLDKKSSKKSYKVVSMQQIALGKGTDISVTVTRKAAGSSMLSAVLRGDGVIVNKTELRDAPFAALSFSTARA